MKKIVISLVIVAILIFMAFKLKSNKEIIEAKSKEALNIEKYDFIPVRVFQIVHQNNVHSVEEIGSFQSRQDLTVSATATGRIINLNVREGQYISKGTVIARLDYAALSAQLATSKVALSNARKDLERIQSAHTVGATTKMQIEQGQLQIDNIQASITNIEEQIKFYTIAAPMSGYVNKILTEQGSFAMPGTPIIQLIDISTIKMVVKVDESIVPLIKVGRSVPVESEVYPGKIFNGKISRIAVQADNSRKFEVEIDLVNVNNQFRAGMNGVVKFDNLSVTDAIFIPRSAIVGSVNDAKVYVVQSDSTVQLTPIQVGAYQGNNIEVKNGLQTNAQVVVMGQINLREGVKVSVVK
ncbi:MAG: efflux RND transporter periplasmic adaptor subunit [Chitinophagales bacterium]|nr:efflux RND transporter periplasmic adaptor subunit [Chitinophagales bacterium]